MNVKICNKNPFETHVFQCKHCSRNIIEDAEPAPGIILRMMETPRWREKVIETPRSYFEDSCQRGSAAQLTILIDSLESRRINVNLSLSGE